MGPAPIQCINIITTSVAVYCVQNVYAVTDSGVLKIFKELMNIYRPQTKFAKVMFLHLSVSHSAHRGGGLGACPIACWDTPTGQVQPPSLCFLHLSVSHSVYRGVPAPLHAGKHTPEYVHPPHPRQVHPLAGTLPGRYTPQQVHPPPAGTPTSPGQVHPQQVHPPPWAGTSPRYHPLAETPPGRYTPSVQCMLGYGQQVGGTNPTGMQSCSCFLKAWTPFLWR